VIFVLLEKIIWFIKIQFKFGAFRMEYQMILCELLLRIAAACKEMVLTCGFSIRIFLKKLLSFLASWIVNLLFVSRTNAVKLVIGVKRTCFCRIHPLTSRLVCVVTAAWKIQSIFEHFICDFLGILEQVFNRLLLCNVPVEVLTKILRNWVQYCRILRYTHNERHTSFSKHIADDLRVASIHKC